MGASHLSTEESQGVGETTIGAIAGAVDHGITRAFIPMISKGTGGGGTKLGIGNNQSTGSTNSVEMEGPLRPAGIQEEGLSPVDVKV